MRYRSSRPLPPVPRAVLLPTVQICLPQLLHIGGGCSNQSISGVLRRLVLPSAHCDRHFIASSSSSFRPSRLPSKSPASASSRFSGCVPDRRRRACALAWTLGRQCPRTNGRTAWWLWAAAVDRLRKAIAMLAVRVARCLTRIPAEAPAGLPVIAVPTTAGRARRRRA